ncbi:MAG: acetyl-CoA C-acetyltransferase [Candidatus Dormibacteraeota bacterium]|uniref:acetyl-CoA C-acetyltransferase n=1 Tax=Candidatus Dormiibacter inghamiae TaxID=3127013 RepID=A0A934K5V8_9BACT|nr:acetyl-CoA C-acetyltransferase [Candidatus Dormibacteraeota bacterium]MBJ7604869.1 acetyl-CoA C-acetyltransferase [Candidatus Dormibacteraeota bacterium]
MTKSVIVAGARTPIGKFGGAFKALKAVELGGVAIRAALERSGIAGEDVEYVIMGQVLQAGAGQITARQAAILGGIPIEVPAITINKVCLSGLNAIAMADQMIRAGEVDTVVAGGMESMSQAPYLMPKARFGARMGNVEMVDSMIHDGLWSTFLEQHMGESSDDVNRELEISREEQDAWAARSHQRAAAAWESGRLAEESVPVSVRRRQGDSALVERDEGVRPDTTAEALAGLKPAFQKDGTITAANASQVSDGAAAVVVMSAGKAAKLGLRPLAEIVAHGMSAERYAWLHTVPGLALNRALERAGLSADQLDLVEFNEAFASVALNATRMLEFNEERVNVNGGSVAIGHPIGASGARLVLTLAHELRRRGERLGGAALCGGGGQGDALIIRNPAA